MVMLSQRTVEAFDPQVAEELGRVNTGKQFDYALIENRLDSLENTIPADVLKEQDETHELLKMLDLPVSH